ncbi:hypothetical protein BAUCODRAFT_148115 [Baudoinia panamericana UAMH 10762]|uniref:DUF1772 domain-containing protein n=1 Tax=Baudoinia panamericana (strain UAMH 10762) TaxID=717646 RepID=M2LQ49_BAUPA|nr:uncharacterized protein BAUCODRAFT_148115 [Baudoinia panamericana UAMH 10762]EMC96517.1 hypothetical protein BAUCODRAFT_148115 [Baudoinia panamericana UAMH 10762]
MASTGNLWWMTPLQAVATLGAAVNFGGSVLQSPLIMPMLQLPDVPAHEAGKMLSYLLHESEKFFPPLNALCTVTNLGLTIYCYLNRNRSRACREKLPFLAISTAFNIATTAWALMIMVPRNQRMTLLAKNIRVNQSDVKSEKEMRQIQQTWQKLNYGRASLMIGSVVAGMYALLSDGSIAKL